MKLKILTQSFSVCKVVDYSKISLENPFVFTAVTDEERSLVCPTSLIPDNTTEREDGWRGFRIEGVLDFSLIGILSQLSTVLAENKIGIFAVSTFNTDYIFIKEAQFDRAVFLLRHKGYEIS